MVLPQKPLLTYFNLSNASQVFNKLSLHGSLFSTIPSCSIAERRRERGEKRERGESEVGKREREKERERRDRERREERGESEINFQKLQLTGNEGFHQMSFYRFQQRK